MGIRYTVTPVGVEGLERRLGKLLKRMGDLTPLMRDIGGYLRDATRQRFEDGEAPDGAKWKPSIRARLTGGQTLVEHGNLRDSITDAATRDSAIVGTNDPRAPIHHYGGIIRPVSADALRFSIPGVGFRTVKQVTMPARPIFGLAAADPSEIGAIVDDYLAGAVA